MCDEKSLFASVDWSAVDLSRRHDALADDVCALLEPLPGKRILDMCCGSATLGVELAERGYAVTGLDWVIDPAQRRAQARGSTIELIEKDVRALDVNAAFDAVVNWDVGCFAMLPDQAAWRDLLCRIYRSLASGGKILIETYNPAYIEANPAKVEGLVLDGASRRASTTVERTLSNGTKRQWHLSLHFPSVQEWRVLLETAGFTVLGAWGSLGRASLSIDARMLVLLACRTPIASALR